MFEFYKNLSLCGSELGLLETAKIPEEIEIAKQYSSN